MYCGLSSLVTGTTTFFFHDSLEAWPGFWNHQVCLPGKSTTSRSSRPSLSKSSAQFMNVSPWVLMSKALGLAPRTCMVKGNWGFGIGDLGLGPGFSYQTLPAEMSREPVVVQAALTTPSLREA